MRAKLRPIVLVFLALMGVMTMGVASAFTAALTWGAATALIVPGTGTPNANIVGNYKENARDYYIAPNNPSCTAGNNCDLVGINYPASFWPIPLPGWCPNLSCDKWNVSVGEGVTNLDTALTGLIPPNPSPDHIVIFGYSQGARVVTLEKINLANGQHGDLTNLVSFVYIGNISRPNGGLWSRLSFLPTIPILDVTTSPPTPTNTGYQTTDIAMRWDGVADFPVYVLNPLADLNAILGFQYVHGTYLAPNANSDPGELPGGYTQAEWQAMMDNPQNYPGIVDVQQYGDTKYITVTPKRLPLVQPLDMVPLIGTPIADLLQPALATIIEQTGYNRSVPFGQPTTFQLIPIFNPIKLAVDLVPAVIQGVQNFINDLGGLTPLSIPFAPAPIAPAGPSTFAAAKTLGTELVTDDTHSVTLSPVPTTKLAGPETTNTDTPKGKTPEVTDLKTTLDTGSPDTTPPATTPSTKPRLPKLWSRLGSDWPHGTKQKTSPTDVFDKPAPTKSSPTGGTDPTSSTGSGPSTGTGTSTNSGAANAA